MRNLIMARRFSWCWAMGTETKGSDPFVSVPDIEQAQASEQGGKYESTEGIGGGVGAMIEGQTILLEEIQR